MKDELLDVRDYYLLLNCSRGRDQLEKTRHPLLGRSPLFGIWDYSTLPNSFTTTMNKKFFWIYTLNSSVYFLQGIGGIAGQPLSYYLKETQHLSPSALMYIGSIVSLAWMLKPLIGFAIDNFGLKRKVWILIALLIDIITAGFLGVMTLPLSFLVTVLMLSNWNTAFRDVAVDGIMVCEGQKNNQCGKIQSVQWIAVTVAGVISTLIGAYLAEKNISYQVGFLLLIPFYCFGVLAASFYSEPQEFTQRESIRTALGKYKVLFQDKKFLWVCLFIFLYKFSPSFGTPLWYIERDVFKWGRFFIGMLGAITSLVSIIGAFIYFKTEHKFKIRPSLIISVWLGAVTSLFYLYFTPVTDIVYGIVFSVVGMFFHLLIMSVMAKQCIKGLESTSFAFLCSVSNIAATLSGVAGGWLLPRVGLQLLILMLKKVKLEYFLPVIMMIQLSLLLQKSIL